MDFHFRSYVNLNSAVYISLALAHVQHVNVNVPISASVCVRGKWLIELYVPHEPVPPILLLPQPERGNVNVNVCEPPECVRSHGGVRADACTVAKTATAAASRCTTQTSSLDRADAEVRLSRLPDGGGGEGGAGTAGIGQGGGGGERRGGGGGRGQTRGSARGGRRMRTRT